MNEGIYEKYRCYQQSRAEQRSRSRVAELLRCELLGLSVPTRNHVMGAPTNQSD